MLKRLFVQHRASVGETYGRVRLFRDRHAERGLRLFRARPSAEPVREDRQRRDRRPASSHGHAPDRRERHASE